MSHTAFVITGITCSPNEQSPSYCSIRTAAHQAVQTAVAMAPSLRAKEIHLGSDVRGRIQGSRQSSGHNTLEKLLPPILHPITDLMLMACRAVRPQHNPFLSVPVYDAKTEEVSLPDMPDPRLLQHSWNTTDRLVKLALKLASDYSPNPGVYPHALLTHDGLVLWPDDLPRTDVFGDPLTCCQQEDQYQNDGHNHHGNGRPHTSDRYFREDTPGMGKSYAIMPMVEIAHARYHADYVRTLADYPGRMAIQLSWN